MKTYTHIDPLFLRNTLVGVVYDTVTFKRRQLASRHKNGKIKTFKRAIYSVEIPKFAPEFAHMDFNKINAVDRDYIILNTLLAIYGNEIALNVATNPMRYDAVVEDNYVKLAILHYNFDTLSDLFNYMDNTNSKFL